MNKSTCIGAASLCALAGLASAQPTIDGKLGAGEAALYGAPLWVQSNPTQFGNAGSAAPCDPNQPGGDPLAVTTGTEIAIPLASLGNPAGAIKLMAFINGQGHDYASNQFLPPLPLGTNNLGGDGAGNYNGGVSGINLNSFAGNQYVTVTPATGTPTIDGTRDAAYGSAVAVQILRTGFGNATSGTQSANGSELDAMYVLQDATNLYVFLAGNCESNFNKLELFIDTGAAGGQNSITGFPGYDGIGTKFNGFTFDTGFNATHHLTFGAGGSPVTFYPNFGSMIDLSGGYLGCNQAGSGNGNVTNACGGDNPNNIQVALDNVNTGGVAGGCPPPAGNVDTSNGSELDGLYAYVDSANNRLYVLLTGNLENSNASPCDKGGNKIMMYFDADGAANGQNPLRADNVDISYGALNKMANLTFDTGFAADYFMAFKTQGGPGSASQVIDSAVLRTGGPRRTSGTNKPLDYGAYDGADKPTLITYKGFYRCNGNPIDPAPQDGFTDNLFTNFGPRAAAESLLANPSNPVGTADLIHATIDNSNINGVSDTSAAGADAVTTGLEFYVDLAELGWDGSSCIKIAGFIDNADGDYLSNQVIGSLPAGQGNLGSDGNGNYAAGTVTVNFNNFAGNQYVEICPPPLCPCTADFDQSGGTPDAGDIDAFFQAWLLGDPTADADCSGGTPDTSDIDIFFQQWLAGGC